MAVCEQLRSVVGLGNLNHVNNGVEGVLHRRVGACVLYKMQKEAVQALTYKMNTRVNKINASRSYEIRGNRAYIVPKNDHTIARLHAYCLAHDPRSSPSKPKRFYEHSRKKLRPKNSAQSFTRISPVAKAFS